MVDFDPSSSLFEPDEPICPYTGLRTFTEDEAIYFRGREAHVAKCLDLLAAQHFVMITGASGDGKSSLVFAGLLPEVRAGFLRARYANWAVATFRPERSPLRNMARALATALHLEGSAAAVETELAQGFSALVQLYQASVLCPPAELPAGLAPAEQRHYQRQAANLLVVVDQFEEFFTNPENYGPDGPNPAAQAVVNLLLETTRLAQAQGLPLYIVCTMRSDFVGQCAEFRGLIEQIGASQYFVPRLLRHEFVEVIREPALLSGNRISERLVQRLLYDIHYGQDQLPVLQHALRRIWLAADEGREEMDLRHYAMVGGLSGELPPAEQARFAAWRATIPAQQQQFLLANASLRNVLDAHANQLYYAATDLYNQDFEPPLPPGTAERVIEQTFRALTRADGQRVVRNRLTGAEITAIIDDETLPWFVICRILRPFRQPGATLLSPFIGEDEDDHEVLTPEAVLDITHESLIRNWAHLAEWAKQEAEEVRIAEDFQQQAERWQANGETSGFLLPIGPYTYFSQWYRRKPNVASWLAHRLDTGAAPAQRQAQAAAQSTLLARFLAASQRRLYVPLLVARYGLGRLAAAVLLPLLLVGLGWWAWAQRTHQADYVAYSIIKERTPLLKSPYLLFSDKAHLLLNAARLQYFVRTPWVGGRRTEEYAFPRMLDELADDSLALNTELSMFSWANNLEYDSVARDNPYTLPLLYDLTRRLNRADSAAQRRAIGPPSARQRELAVCTARLVMALTYYLAYAEQRRVGRQLPAAQQQATGRQFAASRQRLLRRLEAYARQEVGSTAGPPPGPVELGFCLRVLLGQGRFKPAELTFLEGLNPFGAAPARRQFRRLFPPQFTIYSLEGGRTTHSGGYLTGAIVLAALRRPAQVVQCLDSLRGQVAKLDDLDGGLAVLPYLLKYKLLTSANILSLLRHCAAVSGFSFNELYAATTYYLLSVSPSYPVYDVSVENAETVVDALDAPRQGSVNPEVLNYDRVSFSLPLSTREVAWRALQGATPAIAAAEPLFTGRSQLGAHPARRGGASQTARNRAFLVAFLAKMHGTYLQAIRHQPTAAEQEFVRFSTALQDLQGLLQPDDKINSFQWNLGSAEVVEGLTQASSVEQDPTAYLQAPVRPKTLLFEAYYTCPFDAFFAYQLRRTAALPAPDYTLVRRLDSVAFVEVALPDRFATSLELSLRVAALARYPQYAPNLRWLRTVAALPLPAAPARRVRNALLLAVATAIQDSGRLRQLPLAGQVLPFIRRQLPSQPKFAQVPFQVLFSDLATALARAGRVPEAFAVADALGGAMATITKIRASEQAMLTDNQQHQALLDGFLGRYQRQLRQKPLSAASSAIALLEWRPYSDTRHAPAFDSLASFLTKESNSVVRKIGLRAICKGRSLAGQAYQARQAIPTYEPERQRQSYFNNILISLAHRHTTAPSDGWYEYDEQNLRYPVDYDGPAH